jgi:hypothetical protein
MVPDSDPEPRRGLQRLRRARALTHAARESLGIGRPVSNREHPLSSFSLADCVL